VFVRRLALPLFVGAVLAGSTAGISSAGGYTFDTTLDPYPPLVSVPLPAVCQLHFDNKSTEEICTATGNPNPPKDRKSVKFKTYKPKGTCKLTAYPDGSVTVDCVFKGVVE